jgi:hypothetical protein
MQVGNCVYRRVLAGDAIEMCSRVRAGRVETVKTDDVVKPVSWTLVKHPLNTLVLESEAAGDGTFTAYFASTPLPADAGLALRFADDIAEVSVNGVMLEIAATEEGSLAALAGVALQVRNRVSFRPAGAVTRPFLWIEGRVRVVCATGFSGGPGETIRTEGPFHLEPATRLLAADLVAGGFPFLRNPLHIETTLALKEPVARLSFPGLVADAVRLTVDGRDCGWAWGEARFDVELAAGAHTLRLELVPNGYNSYGPHHYYGGDWHVVSPDQIKGVRNFADAADAPANTHVAAWHFRRFTLPGGIAVC